MAYKLLKTLYNLKQALRLWYKRLSKFLLKKLGLRQINTNHNIFLISTDINDPIISIFVNDIKVMGVKRSGHIKRVKQKLTTSAFEMVNIGSINFYLYQKQKKIVKKKY